MRHLLKTNILFFQERHFFSTCTPRVEALVNNAKLYASRGELEQAEKLYWSVLEINPKIETPYREIFNIWAKKGSALGFHNSEKMKLLKEMYNQNIKCISTATKNTAHNSK